MSLECHFREVPEFPSIATYESKKKLGRYHQSLFQNIGDGYVIGVYIDGDFKKCIKKQTALQIMEECLLYLNNFKEKPTRKNKNPNCIYGELKNYRFEIKKDEAGKYYIEALLITSDKNNSHFWGSGREKEKIKW